jgi:chromosome segregation ATPase
MRTWGRRKAQLERLETELAEQIERAGRAEADREGLRAACDHAREEFAAADRRAQQLTAAHAEVTADLTRRAELAEAQVGRLSTQLTAGEAELDTAAAAIEQLRSALAVLQTHLDATGEELTDTRGVLEVEREQAREQLATVREQAERAEADHADQVRELTRRAEDAGSQVRELAGRLERAEAEQMSIRRETEHVPARPRDRTDEATGKTAEATAEQDTAEQDTEIDRPAEPEQPPPAPDPTSERPARPRSPQRQQPSRRRRGRPAK